MTGGQATDCDHQRDVEDGAANDAAHPDVVLGDEEADGAGGELGGARASSHEGRPGHIRGQAQC